VSVLSRDEIRTALADDPPLVEDLDVATQLQPSGIDLRVDRVQWLVSGASLGVADLARVPAAREDVAPDADSWWTLGPGAYVVTYRERVNVPSDMVALSTPRSSLLRSGVMLYSAVWDAGYSGRGEGLLSVMNRHGYRLQRGARILQLVFFRLSAPASEAYRGRYRGENP